MKKTLLVLALVLWFALCITGCQAETAGTTELPSTTIAATTTTIAPFSAAEFRAAHPSDAVFNAENWGELETAPDDHKGASVDVVAKLRDEAMLATADDGHVFWTWTVWIGHEDESWARTSLGLPPDFIAVCCTNPDPEGDSPLGSSAWVHLGGVVLGASDGEFGPRGSALVYVDSVEPSSPATTTTLTEAEYKAKCSRLNYNVLSKNPRSHAGEFYRFTGKIVDIKEDTTTDPENPYTLIWVDVTVNRKVWEDRVFVFYAGTIDVYEEDVVNVWGECIGEERYSRTDVAGDVPGMLAEYVEKAD